MGPLQGGPTLIQQNNAHKVHFHLHINQNKPLSVYPISTNNKKNNKNQPL